MKCAHQWCWMQVCVKSEAHCQIFTKLTKSAQRGGSFLALICASLSPPPSWLRPGNQFQCTSWRVTQLLKGIVGREEAFLGDTWKLEFTNHLFILHILYITFLTNFSALRCFCVFETLEVSSRDSAKTSWASEVMSSDTQNDSRCSCVILSSYPFLTSLTCIPGGMDWEFICNLGNENRGESEAEL